MDHDLSIALRPAQPEHAEGARNLVFSILAEHGLTPDPDGPDNDLEAPDAYYSSRGGCFWVLLDGHRIIATVGTIPRDAKTVELRKMYLHADYRGRQIGQRLLNHAMAWARDRGFRRMILETSTALTAAIGLYRKYGFVESEGQTCNQRCNLIMERDLESQELD